MSKLTVQVQVGDTVRTLDIIEHRLDNPTELMKDILLLAIRSIALNFEAQGRPQRWEHLAAATIARRLGRNRSGRSVRSLSNRRLSGAAAVRQQERYFAAVSSMQILRDRGLLWQSIGGGANGPFSAAGGSGESDKTTMTLTSANPGAWNQFPNMRTGAPARPFMLWQTEDREDMLAMAADFLLFRNQYAA